MGEKERQKKRESLGVPPGRVVLLTSRGDDSEEKSGSAVSDAGEAEGFGKGVSFIVGTK